MRTAPHRRAPASGGLTLIEIMVVLAVLAVLGALALPGLGARMDRERTAAAAEALAADLNEARFEAARQGRPLRLQVHTGPDWCWSVTLSAECPCGGGQACQLRAARGSEHPGIVLVRGHPLTMGPDGRPDGPVEPIELEGRQGSRLRVVVSPMGRAHVCSVRSDAGRHPSCS